jgi:stage II sporulation protein P
MLYFETGRVIRPAEAEPPVLAAPEVETEPVPELLQPPAVFAPEDARTVDVLNYNGYDADLETLITRPLTWNLKQDVPTVLILHTHGTESYTKTEDYKESSDYRTLDKDYNVVSVGSYLAELLEAAGIKTVHDQTLHDYPDFNGSYDHARESIQEYLEQHPEICLVLDLHRDAVELKNGEQFRGVVSTPKGTSAQLMMVVGTDAGGLYHPNWEENMSLAVKMHAQLEKTVPGICRSISFRTQRFNQDLCPGGTLIEVGAAGNTRQEALLAAEYLADAIIQLSGGAVTAGSTR